MTIIFTKSEKQALDSIDELLNTYCKNCELKLYNRKENGKTYAHHFCIEECSVGKQIKQFGNELQ
ncbi:zinc-finger domain-containing protein [Staphylococcus piscifermentans]|uniref:Zinc-finger domain-containing protein n=2 Tax=Staphylococcus TaxID=1279 RepID=A0A512QJ40_9STAP|nr:MULTISPECIES: zinc-finger domain-containing protein [Staphylococcus]AYU55244.1 zinc-finger domain-containing protein [Staphylococcus debuckii]RTX83847.1 zinc-finger domain-containing protein [Staphylococcus piscifermentans]GEP83456.1 zinc-finger domain-containing protein [Staphylococcus piscifermentans]